MPAIWSNIRKILWTNLDKSSEIMFLGLKMPHLPHFGYNKNIPWKGQGLSILFNCPTRTSFQGNFSKKEKIKDVDFWAWIWPIYPILGKSRHFLKKTAPSLFSVYWILTSCKKSAKSNEPISRKMRYWQTDRRTDGQTDRAEGPKNSSRDFNK